MFKKMMVLTAFFGVSIVCAKEAESPDKDYASVLNSMALIGHSEGDNAAPLYVKAFETYSPEPGSLYKMRIWQSWPGELTEEQKAVLQGWVKANDGAIEQLIQGSKKGYFWLAYPEGMPLGAGPLSSYTQVNSLATATCWRAKFKAANGDFSGAMNDLLAVYRFGGHLAARPHRLWEQTTGFTIQTNALWAAGLVLNYTKVDTSTIAAFQNQVQAAMEAEKFCYDLAADKVVVNDAIDRTFEEGKVSAKNLENFKATLKLSEADMARWSALEEIPTKVLARRLFGYCDLTIMRTPGDLKMEKIDLGHEIDSRVEGNVLLEYYRPDIVKHYDMPFRAKAECEAIVAICGITRYLSDKGQLPETLKVAMVSGYMAQEPQDPYREGVMTYVPGGQDYKLYSWGADYSDSFGKPSNWGMGGGDQVFWPVK